MQLVLLTCLAVLLLCGCATSTIQTRKQERAGVYGGLSPDFQALVDKGQIKNGMPMEAVYIAWGKPADIVSGEGPNGVATTTWLYHGTVLVEHSYWSYRSYYSRYALFSQPYLEHDYFPHGYIAAEVHFENGVVKAWRSLPRPPY